MSATVGKWNGPWQTPGNSTMPDVKLPLGHPDISPVPGGDIISGDGAGVFVIHAVLLNNGKVLWWSGHAEVVHYTRECIEWDPKMNPNSPNFIDTNISKFTPPIGIDIFCSHHVHLPDGRILTMGGAGSGGHAGDPSNTNAHGRGIKDICLYTPGVGWEAGELNEARWYPTPVVMPDANIVVFSGRTEDQPVGATYTIAESVELIEISRLDANKPNYTPRTITVLQPDAGAATAATACQAFPTYPGMQLAPDGKIYHMGPNWRYEGTIRSSSAVPPLKVPTAALTVDTKLAVGIWELIPEPAFVNTLREEGSCVLLPPAQDGKILVFGGARMSGNSYPTAPSSGSPKWPPLEPGSEPKSAHILDTLANPVTYVDLPDMKFPRINGNAIILPDQKVLILGGHHNYKWAVKGGLPCEIFDPAAGTFTEVDALREPRTYHHAALLLPDGSVVVAGGVDPTISEEYGPGVPRDPDNPVDNINPANGQTSPYNIKSMEIYQPPYFFLGIRPVINGITDGSSSVDTFNYGDIFVIDTPQANSIQHVGLMRPGAMTHHTDTEQRFVAVTFTQGNGSTLDCTIPNDPKIAPPGPYMVWIVDDQGKPCQLASFITVLPMLSETGETTGSINLESVSPTQSTTNYNGKEYRISTAYGLPIGLEIDGMEIHLDYFEKSNLWGSHHLTFGRFESVELLAEFLIDNGIMPMPMS